MPDDLFLTRTPRTTTTDTLKNGLQLWEATQPIAGTIAERYLREIRKLDLAVVPNLDAVLRFHPRCPFDGAVHPCLIALFRDLESDEVAGIHRIALTAEAEKIGRMMLGSWPNTRAIKLRPAGNTLIVGEGIETTLAAAMKRKSTGALWAMGSAGAIEGLPVIPDIPELVILIDHDAHGAGMNSARQCANRWSAAKRKVVLLKPSHIDSDFNDLV
jgi:hypothetical protein